MRLTAKEALYGGAAGGGKSDALLMAALQFVELPNYASILFRRTYSDLSLPGALMDRAHAWLSNTAAKWVDREKTWTFPSGATLTFGYLDTADDKYRYQSSEFQFIGFDELTQFPERDYRYLFSRLRRSQHSRVPLRMRAASNPGGGGHAWVKQRFLVEGPAAGRVFVPARLADNPFLDAGSYTSSLAELDPITRAQLLRGDWDVHAGGSLFRREWFKIADVVPHGIQYVRAWDLAATEPRPGTDPDWTCGLLMGRAPDGTFYVCDLQHVRRTPAGVEALVRQTAELDGREVGILMELEPGSAGVAMVQRYAAILAGWSFHARRATGSKVTRACPLSSQAQAGRVFLLRGAWNSAFLDEVDAFPEGPHDDIVDAASMAFSALTEMGVYEIPGPLLVGYGPYGEPESWPEDEQPGQTYSPDGDDDVWTC